jgi:hypothetical protein
VKWQMLILHVGNNVSLQMFVDEREIKFVCDEGFY